jgi:iron-sulfur cluster assembly accessory protein
MVAFEGELMENTQAQPGHPVHPVDEAAESGAPEHPVTLTAKAVEMVKITRDQEGIDPSHGLRVAVRGGGCSGFEYALDFEGEERPNDWVYDQHGLKVFVDAVSARYLEGTTVDYVLGMSGAGFKFSNPRAQGTCGCGSSFTV